MDHGQTREELTSNTERLAIEVIADRIARGDVPKNALAHHPSQPSRLD